jgi:uncharacterized protein
MGRILFFVLLVLVIYLVWRSTQRRSSRRSQAVEPRTPQIMVSCATCGLHLPRQEALLLGDRFFCCEEHRRNPPAA